MNFIKAIAYGTMTMQLIIVLIIQKKVEIDYNACIILSIIFISLIFFESLIKVFKGERK